MAEHVTIYEVGPRDGLQSQARIIPTEQKIALVDLLTACGFSHIEVASFVSPKWVPQMADGRAVLTGIQRHKGVIYAALTPNLKGYEAARSARADEVAIFASASETFSRRNINCSIDESFDRFAPVAEAAGRDGVPMRGYVSCVTDCPYEGPIEPDAVARVTTRLLALGCREVSLGDTIGRGAPDTVAAMLTRVCDATDPGGLAGHFHDTHARALDNVETALGFGLRVFDASIGGLGGCPFAPGSAGNVATERLAERLDRVGYSTGLKPDALARAAEFAATLRPKA